jgi:hypothetical protein
LFRILVFSLVEVHPMHAQTNAQRFERSWCQWLKPVILPTLETKIERIVLLGWLGQRVHEIPPQQIAGHSGVFLSTHVMQAEEIERIVVSG